MGYVTLTRVRRYQMIIIGLFWFSLSGYLFFMKHTPEFMYYAKLSERQINHALLFNLVYAVLSCLVLVLLGRLGFGNILEPLALVLMVIGALLSFYLLLRKR